MRLTENSSKTVCEFDVIGVDGDISEFVVHVGLISKPLGNVSAGTLVPLLHMQPPLAYSDADISASVWGTAGLTANEIMKIRLFGDEQIGEYETHGISDRLQYCIMPAPPDDQSSDGTMVHDRYSCASFVVEAYHRARIHFLETASELLPLVSLETLKRAYPEPDQQRALDSPGMRRRLHLMGDGPWPVLLPGYVLNALNRDNNAIRADPPYRAVSGDEYFPSRRAATDVGTLI